MIKLQVIIEEYLIPILYLHGKIITILNLTIICIILKLKTHYSFGRMRLTDISGELRNQQYKCSQQITNMPNEEEMINLDKKMNKKLTHLETFFKQ